MDLAPRKSASRIGELPTQLSLSNLMILVSKTVYLVLQTWWNYTDSAWGGYLSAWNGRSAGAAQSEKVVSCVFRSIGQSGITSRSLQVGHW
jgi:hypothetical protein